MLPAPLPPESTAGPLPLPLPLPPPQAADVNAKYAVPTIREWLSHRMGRDCLSSSFFILCFLFRNAPSRLSPAVACVVSVVASARGDPWATRNWRPESLPMPSCEKKGGLWRAVRRGRRQRSGPRDRVQGAAGHGASASFRTSISWFYFS